MRHRRRIVAATLALALIAAAPLSAMAAADRPPITLQASLFGEPPVLAPRTPTQVAVFDRQTRTTAIASHDQSGASGNASSSRPSVSADGSFVAFESEARLLTADGNNRADVYAWQRATGALELVSLAPGSAQANGASHEPSISGDGSVIAFSSGARNLTGDAGLDGTSQVFAAIRATGQPSEIRLVSAGRRAAGTGASSGPSVSLDGRIVAFESAATNIVRRDNNDAVDVFLRNLARGATIRASVTSDGGQLDGPSRRPSLAGDGGVVAFDSAEVGIVPGDTNGVRDVFVRDLPPAVEVSPNPLDYGVVPLGTPASLSVTVVSTGWTQVSMTSAAIGGEHAGDFVVADDACSGLTLDFGLACTIAVLDVPQAPGARNATLTIVDTASDSPQVVELLGGVGPPQLRFDPGLGPPGIVATVSGSGFPPGALVTLRWDRGISQPLAPIAVGADGSFTLGVLVFHNDLIGPRELVATTAFGGPVIPELRAAFLVVPAPLQPPGSGPINFADPGLDFILIRR